MKQEDLRDLNLDADIGSSEGLSVDQLTRSRLQFLLGQNANIVRQMQFADAKAGTLLAIVGVLTLIVAERQSEMHSYLIAAHFLVTVMIVGICLIALIPRVPGDKDIEAMRKSDLFSWPALSSKEFEASGYSALMRRSEASQLVMSVATSNVAMAGILRLKYNWLRRALVLALADLVAVAALLNAPAFAIFN